MSELVELKYNEKELADLSKDVIDLNETFKMVSEMVAIQGEKLELLEDSIDDTLDNIDRSNTELVLASNLQTNATKKKVFITGVGLLAVSVPIASVVGYGISIPITIGGFCAYKLIKNGQKLFKDKANNNN